jgi:uncharacterized protein (TIGR03086 family)
MDATAATSASADDSNHHAAMKPLRRLPSTRGVFVGTDAVARHLRACDGFSAVVEVVGDRWSAPSPCPEWDARGVVEHVIGFHDVLLLRPLWLKPHRPKGDPVARWEVTVAAIASALDEANVADLVAVPGLSTMQIAKLLPMLTTDVLVHTWDLAVAVGETVSLDPELCAEAYEVALKNVGQVQSSGMFAPPVPMADDADPTTKLVALLGRGPDWRAP